MKQKNNFHFKSLKNDLKIHCEEDSNIYQKGIKISDSSK